MSTPSSLAPKSTAGSKLSNIFRRKQSVPIVVTQADIGEHSSQGTFSAVSSPSNGQFPRLGDDTRRPSAFGIHTAAGGNNLLQYLVYGNGGDLSRGFGGDVSDQIDSQLPSQQQSTQQQGIQQQQQQQQPQLQQQQLQHTPPIPSLQQATQNGNLSRKSVGAAGQDLSQQLLEVTKQQIKAKTAVLLGKGGFAQVYLLMIEGSPVAVKIHDRNTKSKETKYQFMGRVEREVHSLNKARGHPNILRIFATVTDSSKRIFQYTEFAGGGSLEDVLTKSQGPLWKQEFCCNFVKIVRAIDFLHSIGIVHRDIKPANILYDTNGELKISDFGSAADTTNAFQMLANFGTTEIWSAPEVNSALSNIDTQVSKSIVFGEETGSMQNSIVMAHTASIGQSKMSLFMANKEPTPPNVRIKTSAEDVRHSVGNSVRLSESYPRGSVIIGGATAERARPGDTLGMPLNKSKAHSTSAVFGDAQEHGLDASPFLGISHATGVAIPQTIHAQGALDMYAVGVVLLLMYHGSSKMDSWLRDPKTAVDSSVGFQKTHPSIAEIIDKELKATVEALLQRQSNKRATSRDVVDMKFFAAAEILATFGSGEAAGQAAARGAIRDLHQEMREHCSATHVHTQGAIIRRDKSNGQNNAVGQRTDEQNEIQMKFVEPTLQAMSEAKKKAIQKFEEEEQKRRKELEKIKNEQSRSSADLKRSVISIRGVSNIVRRRNGSSTSKHQSSLLHLLSQLTSSSSLPAMDVNSKSESALPQPENADQLLNAGESADGPTERPSRKVKAKHGPRLPAPPPPPIPSAEATENSTASETPDISSGIAVVIKASSTEATNVVATEDEAAITSSIQGSDRLSQTEPQSPSYIVDGTSNKESQQSTGVMSLGLFKKKRDSKAKIVRTELPQPPCLGAVSNVSSSTEMIAGTSMNGSALENTPDDSNLLGGSERVNEVYVTESRASKASNNGERNAVDFAEVLLSDAIPALLSTSSAGETKQERTSVTHRRVPPPVPVQHN